MSVPVQLRLAAGLTLCALVASLATAAAPSAPKQEADCLRDLGTVDLQLSTIPEIQEAIEAGALDAEDLATRHLRRIAAFDEELNAVRSLSPVALERAAQMDAERELLGPRSLMHGMTVLLKDNVGTRDLPTTAGSIALEGHVPATDAVVTQRLRDAGAVVLGKANLSEFANWMGLTMPNGYSSLGGQVKAPYRFGKDPSGSSTGSAVAASMAYATITIGTETSGSIISPAFTQGLAAIKPTIGLVSAEGIIPLAPTFDTAGPMARSVVDVAIGLDVIDDAQVDYLAGLSTTSLEGVRIAVRQEHTAGGSLLELFPSQREIFIQALADLERQGAVLVVVDDPVPALANTSLLELGAIPNEFKVGINAFLAGAEAPTGVRSLSDVIAFNRQHPDRVPYGQHFLEVSGLQSGLAVDPVMLGTAAAARAASRGWIDQVMAQYDVDAIVAPNASQANLAAAAGYPNVVVPSGMDSSNPQGLSIVGRSGADAFVLSLAHDYEQATAHRIPPTQVNDLIAYCAREVTVQDAFDVVAASDHR